MADNTRSAWSSPRRHPICFAVSTTRWSICSKWWIRILLQYAWGYSYQKHQLRIETDLFQWQDAGDATIHGEVMHSYLESSSREYFIRDGCPCIRDKIMSFETVSTLWPCHDGNQYPFEERCVIWNDVCSRCRLLYEFYNPTNIEKQSESLVLVCLILIVLRFQQSDGALAINGRLVLHDPYRGDIPIRNISYDDRYDWWNDAPLVSVRSARRWTICDWADPDIPLICVQLSSKWFNVIAYQMLIVLVGDE